MSEFGLEIYASNGALVLGMQHFTLQKIYEATIPAQISARQNGWRTDTINHVVPGYDPNTCFVLITPQDYQGSTQGAYTPTFRDIGGETIGVITYVNWEYYNGNRFVQYNLANSVISTLEVVKVLS